MSLKIRPRVPLPPPPTVLSLELALATHSLSPESGAVSGQDGDLCSRGTRRNDVCSDHEIAREGRNSVTKHLRLDYLVQSSHFTGKKYKSISEQLSVLSTSVGGSVCPPHWGLGGWGCPRKMETEIRRRQPVQTPAVST